MQPVSAVVQLTSLPRLPSSVRIRQSNPASTATTGSHNSSSSRDQPSIKRIKSDFFSSRLSTEADNRLSTINLHKSSTPTSPTSLDIVVSTLSNEMLVASAAQCVTAMQPPFLAQPSLQDLRLHTKCETDENLFELLRRWNKSPHTPLIGSIAFDKSPITALTESVGSLSEFNQVETKSRSSLSSPIELISDAYSSSDQQLAAQCNQNQSASQPEVPPASSSIKQRTNNNFSIDSILTPSKNSLMQLSTHLQSGLSYPSTAAAAAAAAAATTLNQLNSISHLGQLNHLNQLNKLNQLNQINQLNQLNQLSSSIGHLNHLNQLTHLNQLGHLSPNTAAAAAAAAVGLQLPTQPHLINQHHHHHHPHQHGHHHALNLHHHHNAMINCSNSMASTIDSLTINANLSMDFAHLSPGKPKHPYDFFYFLLCGVLDL